MLSPSVSQYKLASTPSLLLSGKTPSPTNVIYDPPLTGLYSLIAANLVVPCLYWISSINLKPKSLVSPFFLLTSETYVLSIFSFPIISQVPSAYLFIWVIMSFLTLCTTMRFPTQLDHMLHTLWPGCDSCSVGSHLITCPPRHTGVIVHHIITRPQLQCWYFETFFQIDSSFYDTWTVNASIPGHQDQVILVLTIDSVTLWHLLGHLKG